MDYAALHKFSGASDDNSHDGYSCALCRASRWCYTSEFRPQAAACGGGLCLDKLSQVSASEGSHV